jgi:hypothetical protein
MSDKIKSNQLHKLAREERELLKDQVWLHSSLLI